MLGRLEAGASGFSPFRNLQTDVCTHAASFATGTVTSFQGVKRLGRDVESSPARSADVKDE